MEPTSNKFLVPGAIVVAGAFVAAAIYFGAAAPAPQAGINNPADTTVKVEPVNNDDHILGSRSAPIVIIEYSDTECPFCKVFHNTMKEVMSAYGEDVAWVYRHFPIAQLHAKASKEAEATECAAELGGNAAFWKYLDRIFELTKSNDSLDAAQLPKIAVEVGLNEAAFNECLSSGKYAEAITASVEEAIKAGARGTPYSIIIARGGGQAVINGAEPIANVKAKIDLLLK